MTAKSRKLPAPSRTPSKRTAQTEQVSPVGKRQAKSSARAEKVAHTSKYQHCLDLLTRRDGATLAELVTATGWQPHSVRGLDEDPNALYLKCAVLRQDEGQG